MMTKTVKAAKATKVPAPAKAAKKATKVQAPVKAAKVQAPAKATKVPAPAKAAKATKVQAPVAPAKKETVKDRAIAMLKKGVSIDALMEAFKWQRHTTRGFVSILGRTMSIESSSKDGIRFYKAS